VVFIAIGMCLLLLCKCPVTANFLSENKAIF